MIEVLLQVQVGNAGDRDKDRIYTKRARFPVVPPPYTTLRLGEWRPRVSVLEMAEGDDMVVAVLEPDNENYRGADFGRLCVKWEGLGFTEAKRDAAWADRPGNRARDAAHP